MALFLLALTFPKKKVSGVLYGGSFLVAQQVLVGAPGAVWWVYHHMDRQTVLHVALTAILTVGIGYIATGVIWGIDALIAALQQTILLAGGYATEASQFHTNGSLITSFDQYYPYIIQRAKRIEFLLFGGAAGLTRAVYNRKGLSAGVWLTVSLALLFSTVLAIRIYRHYWILPIPAYAVLCAYFIDGVRNQFVDLQRRLTLAISLWS